ncbi:UNKNOWN [Stylonychia lemnae]|uniref:Uncharacterized protein n=1 Tax=Stylonychia lemnae TaxID=5949 RepID=A0A078B1L2_STYLE|nr:UNKNOWN [Stylonychia lemnae]|eukprot:CDW87163.1 UNKNOWN [Stylonychia lemnae]
MSQDSAQKNGAELGDGQKIEDYLQVLEEHRRNCEKEGNFVEAEMAKSRIEEMKVQEAQRQLEQLVLKHQQEKAELEDQHQREYDQFNQEWDQRMSQKDQEHQLMLQQLDEQHQRDLEKNRIDLDQKIPAIFKPSSELLNLKKIQDQLAKQKEYGEAHKVQQKIIELSKEEEEKYSQVRQKKIVAAETLMIQKQQQQMNALRKKCDNSMSEDRKLREQQHEKMLQKYSNVKREIESQQSLERIKLEKLFGKQLLASQSSLSYGLKKNDQAYSSKGFSSNSSPKKGSWGAQTGRDNASKQL